eukprot:6189221-Pleurochrysis_carterae.AAC.3
MSSRPPGTSNRAASVRIIALPRNESLVACNGSCEFPLKLPTGFRAVPAAAVTDGANLYGEGQHKATATTGPS